MSRLTKKEPNNLSCHHFRRCEYLRNGTPRVETLNKLGKLEDLEEELGCPLEVVFKAMKYGIEFEHKLTNDKLISKSIRAFYFQNEWVIRAYIERYNAKEAYDRYLKDYKKTWWLRGERDENSK